MRAEAAPGRAVREKAPLRRRGYADPSKIGQDGSTPPEARRVPRACGSVRIHPGAIDRDGTPGPDAEHLRDRPLQRGDPPTQRPRVAGITMLAAAERTGVA